MKPDEFRGKRSCGGCRNSVVDIACDAAKFADKAFFSVRRGYRFVPKISSASRGCADERQGSATQGRFRLHRCGQDAGYPER